MMLVILGLVPRSTNLFVKSAEKIMPSINDSFPFFSFLTYGGT